MNARHFTPAFFAFLRDLNENNDRDWFAANRARFIADVEGPMLVFSTIATWRTKSGAPDIR